MQLGAINQRGAYFDLLNIETGEVLYDGKIQGKPALLKLLRENPELFKKLQDQISYN